MDTTKSNVKKRKFTLLEISGAFGDWGTLIPYIIGYVSIVGFDPASIFLCVGVTNILLGIRFNLPLPVQPQKTIGAIAIAQSWSSKQVISTGFGTGLIWIVAGFSKKFNDWVKRVPKVVVKAIQMGLALILTLMALKLLTANMILSIISIILILIGIFFPKIPSALLLTIIGIVLVFTQGQFSAELLSISLPKLQFHFPSFVDLGWGMLYAGFAQIILTFTNVMVATVSLANQLFPQEEKPLQANILAKSMGITNIVTPFLGGIPLCHGSGGLAAQYQFGARTGGSMIVEGIIEVGFGLFCSNFLLLIFTNFPDSIFGAMLLFTAFLLAKVSFTDISYLDIPIILIAGICSVLWNISIGFVVALLIYLIFMKVKRERKKKEEEIVA